MTEPWLCPNPDCSHRVRAGEPAELPPEVDVCPHCGTDGSEFVPLVMIASFPEPYLAHLVRSRLEADGIVATLSDEHLASMTAIAGDGGVKLRVRRDQVEAALAIMQGAADEPDEFSDDVAVDAAVAEPDRGAPVCPRCGGASAAMLPRTGLFARVFGARRQCERCGNAWRA